MAAAHDTSAEGTETTPLLNKEPSPPRKYGKSVLHLAIFAGFMISMSFGVTQVPLIYVFRLMTCEAWYHTHPEPAPGPALDRCQLPEVDAGTARSVALLGASTTLFGLANLFVTGWCIKKLGIKSALLISVFMPAIRLAIQNVGVMKGGAEGIVIVQASQIITIFGGPAGYLLALNSYVAEVVLPAERTGSLGMLQGGSFLGTAIAYLAGGLIGEYFGILAPFQVTVMLFLSSCTYVLLFLPWIPASEDKRPAPTSGGIAKFFGPLKIFSPHKWVLSNGRVKKQYGTILLGIGTFLGVLATGYVPVMLQMYATDVYNFGTKKNGYLISLNCFIRGLFLSFAFPKIISLGRTWIIGPKDSRPSETTLSNGNMTQELPIASSDLATLEAIDGDEDPMPVEPTMPSKEHETFEFDLLYTRYSLLADAILTGAAVFVSSGNQMFIIAAVLPFASGTGASAKGTILQMCSSGERADALIAINLVEMMARLATVSVFGLVYAAFAEAGRSWMVFACNAAVALVGFCVLLLSRFPPDGSKRFEEEEEQTHGESHVNGDA